jgi:hypothetical protein
VTKIAPKVAEPTPPSSIYWVTALCVGLLETDEDFLVSRNTHLSPAKPILSPVSGFTADCVIGTHCPSIKATLSLVWGFVAIRVCSG